MLKIFSVVNVLFLSLAIHAQIAIKSSLHNISNMDCDYKITISTLNLPGGGQLVRKKYDNNINQYVYTSINEEDTIIDFCFGEQLEYFFNGIGIANYGGTLPNRTNFSYEILDYQAPSSDLAADGSITLKLESLPMIMSGGILGTGFADYPTELDSLIYRFDNLQTGVFHVETIYQTNVVINGFFNIFIGDPQSLLPQSDLMFDFQIFDDTVSTCQGSIQLTPLNAIGDVTYSWDNDSTITGNYQGNLCPGIYSILATDASQNSALLYIPIMDSNAIYNDSSIFTSYANDTIYVQILNCAIDYTQEIDSIFYDDTLVSTNGNSSIYNFTLNVYQDSNMYVFTSSIIVENEENTLLSIGIYCDFFRTLKRGKRINLIRKSENLAELNKLNIPSNFKLFPNPTTNLIEFSGLTNYEGTIYDVDGRIIHQLNSNIISLETLKTGLYFVYLNELNMVFTIIKY